MFRQLVVESFRSSPLRILDRTLEPAAGYSAINGRNAAMLVQ